MNKKWQVAEKCRTDGASVHHVYGFRYVLGQSLFFFSPYSFLENFELSNNCMTLSKPHFVRPW
jgi:hypothetical protein